MFRGKLPKPILWGASVLIVLIICIFREKNVEQPDFNNLKVA